MVVWAQFCRVVAVSTLATVLASCNTVGEPNLTSAVWNPDSAAPYFPETTPTVQDPADVKYYASDEPLRQALEHFNRGHFGIAERYFQDAVEKAPKDATAWVGLAATYDRLARFDLADRAYSNAVRLVGETAEILNNEGYSYMLRGDLVKARHKLSQASARAPNDRTIANNIALLNSSYKYIRRSSPDEQSVN